MEISGDIEKKKRKGTFISESKIVFDISSPSNGYASQVTAKEMMTLSIEVLDFKKTNHNEEFCNFFKIPPRSEVYTVQRVLSFRKLPVILSLSYLPCELFPDLNEHLLQEKTLDDILGLYRIDVASTTKKFEAKRISTFECSIFHEEKNSPVLYCESTCLNPQKNPVLFSMARYRMPTAGIVCRIEKDGDRCNLVL